jgi:hypothetical protein
MTLTRQVFFSAALLVPMTLSAQDEPVLLTVGGAMKTPLALTTKDLEAMPCATAEFDRDGERRPMKAYCITTSS